MPRFFVKDRVSVLAAVRQIGDNLCVYMGGKDWMSRTCDCKYGGPVRDRGAEQSGCPEMRNVEHLLSVLTDDEYNELLKREKLPIDPEHLS